MKFIASVVAFLTLSIGASYAQNTITSGTGLTQNVSITAFDNPVESIPWNSVIPYWTNGYPTCADRADYQLKAFVTYNGDTGLRSWFKFEWRCVKTVSTESPQWYVTYANGTSSKSFLQATPNIDRSSVR